MRLWDGRIGRWLTVDPAGEFFSPYLGMGNNPISLTDPDGGCVKCDQNAANGSTYTDASGASWTKGADGWSADNFSDIGVDLGMITNKGNGDNLNPAVMLMLTSVENLGGKVKIPNVGDLGPRFTNMSGSNIDLPKGAKIASGVLTAIKIGGNLYDVVTTEGSQQDLAAEGLVANIVIEGISYVYPVIGVVINSGQIMMSTERYQNAIHDSREREQREKLEEGRILGLDQPKDLEFRQSDGVIRDSNGNPIN